MNSIIKRFCIISGALWVTSCSDLTFWNDFLDNQPESSGATTEIMFSSRENAEKVLTQAYTGLIYGISSSGGDRLGGNLLESLTDLCHSYRNNAGDGPTMLYYNGFLNPNNMTANAAYFYGSESDWRTIRYAWLFIENVDKVPDYPEKDRRVAEAKTLIALSYFRMMRYVGGVPWLDHAIDINESKNFPRQTFETTVNNIVKLLDDAMPYLKWKEDFLNEGRMTRAGAMGLKVQVLLWAASPTFNSDTKWHPEADEYTCYGNYSKERWTRAEEAAKKFFIESEKYEGEYALVLPDEDEKDKHLARRLAYRKAYYDRGNTETLISIRKGYEPSTHNAFLDRRVFVSPTLNYVDMFPWEDGTDFPTDFNWENPEKQPFFTKGDLKPTRDPRLYETVACAGDILYNETAVPVYTSHAEYRPGQGLLVMKFVLQKASDRNNRPVQWPYLRLPEIMLSYAEILNELHKGPTKKARDLVNEVRARVGLGAIPDNLDYKGFLKAILRERALEFGFEEVRWFDLVRRGCKEEFTKTLYNLEIQSNHLTKPTEFTFKKIKVDGSRYWADHWDTKWYLSPIPQKEINKQYGMTQNPGW